VSAQRETSSTRSRWPGVCPAGRLLWRALADDRGAVAVSFILTFPIFLLIAAIIVQYALLLNARLVVEHAAQTAARAAATALPDERPELVLRAARTALAPLSPRAGVAPEAEALRTAEALADCGVNVAESFADRYTYAMAATRAAWSGGGWPNRAGREVEVTVRYRFLLTVPGASRLISAGRTSVAGVEGRFTTLVATARAQASHGRKAAADSSGWPW